MIGRGWAPVDTKDSITLIAENELKILLNSIFKRKSVGVSGGRFL